MSDENKHDTTRALVGAVQTGDLENATEILDSIIDRKQKERYELARKNIEEA